MHRTAQALLVALAVVVFGIAGYVVVHGPDVKDAGTTPAGPALSTQPTTSSVSPSGATSDPGSRRVVAFLGDDWTLGRGASSSQKGFVPLLGQALGVDARAFGTNDGGYSHPGDADKTYADLVSQVVKANPDVVVVTGGRNDQPDYGPTAAADAKTLFAKLHKKLPNATLIAVAPWWGDSDLPPQMSALGSAVKSAVHAAGGHYIDLSDPIHDHPKYMANSSDPDDAGYAAVAKALAAKLQPLLTQS